MFFTEPPEGADKRAYPRAFMYDAGTGEGLEAWIAANDVTEWLHYMAEAMGNAGRATDKPVEQVIGLGTEDVLHKLADEMAITIFRATLQVTDVFPADDPPAPRPDSGSGD